MTRLQLNHLSGKTHENFDHGLFSLSIKNLLDIFLLVFYRHFVYNKGTKF